jgi:putative transposase
MSQRHPIQHEALMFVTTNTRARTPLFAHAPYANEAVETLYRVREQLPFLLHGFVIMPDHCHILLRVPAPASVSTIIGTFKSGVSFNIGNGPIWQRRFHLRLPDDAMRVLAYIHRNPVRAGLVQIAEDYPWSSASGRWDVTALDG